MFDDRKIVILYSVINTYITDGKPVGSKSLAKEYNLNISPATIRNEMSLLEKMGYLEKEHTSSGRFPSDRGYRIYVNDILNNDLKSDSNKEFEKVKEYFDDRKKSAQIAIETATKALSEMTNFVSIGLYTNANVTKLISLELVSISKNDIILISVYDNSMVLDEMIHIDNPIEYDDIYYLNRIIKEILIDCDVADIKEKLRERLKDNLNTYLELLDILDEKIEVKKDLGSNSRVYVEGLSNIFNYKEFSNVEVASEIIKFFDGKENIKDLLEKIKKPFVIRIGEENKESELKNTTLIASDFSFDKNFSGKIAVIGPTRMQYRKVISDIQLVSFLLNQ
ncbi:MAG: heat-inducible transcriptional repressor HrcA [Tissierellia bacterium]|nr:heat-inducible transcriptional repressor HrcA [Tissierellia bacterium]